MNEFLKLRAEYLFYSNASSNVAARELTLMPLLRHADYSFSYCQFFHSFQRFIPKKDGHCHRN
jgi:hypothetical protein